jgi:PAS domain S-box-containing protein
VYITAAVSAEEELQESEEKFRGVAERSSDIIQLTDRTGRMMYISPSVKRILGFEPDELIGSPPEKLVHPDELPLVQDMIRKNIESGGAVESIETRVLRKDGKYALLEVSVSPIIKDRAFAGMQIMARDVTERKAAQARIEELQKEQKEQMEIINTGPVIVFLWKAKENWPVETVSSNISQYGYTTGDFISGRISYGSIIHPDDLPRVTAEVEYNGANKTDTFYQTYRSSIKTGTCTGSTISQRYAVTITEPLPTTRESTLTHGTEKGRNGAGPACLRYPAFE